ncbi:MAG: sigma-70 family RNA polymerase sigma factor [Kiritimatiellae bacterium]|nr:sigma-70 family RNA polymerase sigma factor [Kiritimatiellia bacterium]
MGKSGRFSGDEPTDGELVRRYLAGDDGAFEAVYARYRRPLYAYLNRMLPGQSATVDDLYQQTWVKAVNWLRRYRDRDRFLAWLLRIAHNVVVDYYRRHAVRDEVAMATVPVEADRATPGARLIRDEENAVLKEAVDRLPKEQREVVWMRLSGLSFREIAAVQHTSVNTALGRMHYAIKHLKTRLIEDEALA